MSPLSIHTIDSKSILVTFFPVSQINKLPQKVSVFDKPLGPAEQYENIFSFEEPIIIRTLPQYSTYYGVSYNKLLKEINSDKSITEERLIKYGKEYRILCSNNNNP